MRTTSDLRWQILFELTLQKAESETVTRYIECSTKTENPEKQKNYSHPSKTIFEKFIKEVNACDKNLGLWWKNNDNGSKWALWTVVERSINGFSMEICCLLFSPVSRCFLFFFAVSLLFSPFLTVFGCFSNLVLGDLVWVLLFWCSVFWFNCTKLDLSTPVY